MKGEREVGTSERSSEVPAEREVEGTPPLAQRGDKFTPAQALDESIEGKRPRRKPARKRSGRRTKAFRARGHG